MGNPSPWQLGFGQLPDFVVGSIKSRVDRESWRHFTFACQSSCAASYACRRHVRLYADRDSGVVVPSMARLATCFPALEQLTLDDDKGVVVAALGCLPDGALPSVRQVEGGYYEGLADEELQQLVRLCPKVERVVKCAVTATAAVLPLLAPWGGSLQKVSCTTNFGRTQWEPRQIAAASAALTSLTRLQDLEMDCGEGRGAIVLAAALPALTSLTRLNLEDWSFASLALVLHSCAASCSALRALQLGRMWSEARGHKACLDWKDHDWAGFRGLELPGITSLTLWTNDWGKSISFDTEVTLSANWFAQGDIGLHTLFPSLESLVVDDDDPYGCGLDIDAGALPTFHTLRELAVPAFCCHSSGDGARGLRFAGPQTGFASRQGAPLLGPGAARQPPHPREAHPERLPRGGCGPRQPARMRVILSSLPRLSSVTLEGKGWNLWPCRHNDPYAWGAALLRSLAAWQARGLKELLYDVEEFSCAALPLGYVLPRLAIELGPTLERLELYPCRLPRAGGGGGGLAEGVHEGGLRCLPLFQRLRYMELHIEAEIGEGRVRLPTAKECIEALVAPLVSCGCVGPCLRELVVKLPARDVTSGVWAHCDRLSAQCPGGVLRFKPV